MNCCDDKCHEGHNCPIRSTFKLPIQYAEPEPIGSDWVDMAMLSVAAGLLVFIGFVIGRAWG